MTSGYNNKYDIKGARSDLTRLLKFVKNRGVHPWGY